jgi:hypothetical protein
MEFKSGEYFQKEFSEGELDLALLKKSNILFFDFFRRENLKN